MILPVDLTRLSDMELALLMDRTDLSDETQRALHAEHYRRLLEPA